jgi:hypothetical protein
MRGFTQLVRVHPAGPQAKCRPAESHNLPKQLPNFGIGFLGRNVDGKADTPSPQSSSSQAPPVANMASHPKQKSPAES